MIDISYEYLAGLFDGEGTVSLFWDSRYKTSLHIRISITSTDEFICNELVYNFGGTVNLNGKPKEGHKKSYRWTVYGLESVRLMESIEDLCIIKQKVIYEAKKWEYLKRGFSRNNPVPEEELNNRKELFNNVKKLNKRGSMVDYA